MVYSLSITTFQNHHERRIPCRNFILIQINLARNLLSKLCAKLFVFIRNIIFSDDFKSRHRLFAEDFTRDRKLPFHNLILLMLNLMRGSYQDELDHFFKALQQTDVAGRVVTKAALSKARLKLRYEAFRELNEKLNHFVDDHFNPKTWNGFRLLAVDGSTTRLPHTPDVEKHFGLWRCRKGKPSPMARLSQLYDTLNKITVDACIRPKRIGERQLAAEHCRHLMPHDLLLLDRGYPAWWLFALILSRKANFCARISSRWKVVRSFVASGKKESIVYLPAPPTSVRAITQLGLDRTPLKLRLIRIEQEAKVTVLITSLLDNQQYPHDVFSDLYHLRWPIEEDYKVLKCRLEVENFTGKSVHSIYQDFHAKVLMKNLAAVLTSPVNDELARAPGARRYNYQVNFTQALSRLKETLVVLFTGSACKIRRLIEALFALFQRTTEPIRPGRKQPRNHRIKPRKFFCCYKALA